MPAAFDGEDIVRGASAEAGAAAAYLSAAAAFFGHVMNAMPTPMFVKDEQYRIVFCNDAFCATMRHSRDAMLGRTDFELMAADEAEIFRAQDAHVFRTGQP